MTEPTSEEVRHRLTLVSPDLVRELYEILKSEVQSEASRQTRLDGKANSLITAAGLSLTVASSLWGIVASRPNLTFPWWLVLLWLAVALLGFAAVTFGVLALKVSTFNTLSLQAVFNAEMLERADNPPGAGDLERHADKYAFGVALYRQYLIPHLMDVWDQNAQRIGRKARLIKWGQYSFLAFLFALLTCELLMFAIESQSHAGETAATTASTSTQGATGRGAGTGAGTYGSGATQAVVSAMPDKPPPPPPPPPPREVQEQYVPRPAPAPLPPQNPR